MVIVEVGWSRDTFEQCPTTETAESRNTPRLEPRLGDDKLRELFVSAVGSKTRNEGRSAEWSDPSVRLNVCTNETDSFAQG